MSDYFDKVFGKTENESPEQETPKAEAPVPEIPEVPEEPQEPEIPEIPEEPKEPEVKTEEIPEPVREEEPAAPETPAPAVPEPPKPEIPAAPQQPAAPQTRGTFFTPTYSNGQPVQQRPNGGYVPPQGYIPPVQPPVQQGYVPPVQSSASDTQTVPAAPPKKGGKGLMVIMIIAILCAVIAVGGLVISSRGGSDSGDNKSNKNESSFFDEFGKEDEKEDEDADEESDKSDAQVDVNSSGEAAKTDENGNLTVAGVVEQVKDSCVGITVYTKQDAYSYFGNYGNGGGSGDDKTASGEGSGVIMSEANGKTYIMTCAHVISDGSSFTVTLDNDKEYEATIVGYDSQTDIGVLSINETGLQTAEFGDSGDIELGEDCIAIGCPGGLTFKNSVTRGIVSGLDVPVSSSIGYSNECIQVDAAINPGNSGGALFNMQGQVIGINSSKIASTDYEGMGFAVPSNTAVDTANAIIKDGYVAGRARLGISYLTLENYNSAQSILSALADKGFKNANGTMVVQEVSEDSDLKGKIEQYDMIVAINGKTLTDTDVITSFLAKSKPGDKVKITVARIDGNKIKTFDVECKLIEYREK